MKRWIAAGLAVLAVAGCATPGYYWQAVNGQFELLRLSQPIDEVRAQTPADSALNRKLAAVASIRDFASRELGLPDNGSYRKYADLKRPFVVWNVFAADEFSVRPSEWCFPIAGCVTYRGYFDKADAEAYAASLRAEGYETYVGGVPAYSTLGWFDDPVLSTFINYSEPEIARLMFHELAHQVAYAGGDSEFNESFAVAVEEAGMERWLARRGDTQTVARLALARGYRADFAALVLKYRQRLADLYASSEDAAAKRRTKAAIIADMHGEYQQTKATRWGGFRGYDAWFAGGINNAKLASVGIYTGLLPEFKTLLADQGGNLRRFYAEVKQLAQMPREERRRILAGRMPALTASYR